MKGVILWIGMLLLLASHGAFNQPDLWTGRFWLEALAVFCVLTAMEKRK